MRFKALGVLLGGGAVSGVVGTAIFYVYLWGLGGVPIGQLAQIGVFSKVILPTTLFLFLTLLSMWVAPGFMVFGSFASDKADPSFLRLFTKPRSAVLIASVSGSTAQAAQSVGTGGAGGQTPDDGLGTLQTRRLALGRVFGFSGATAGLASMWPLSLSIEPEWIGWSDSDRTWIGVDVAVGLLACSFALLLWLWKCSAVGAPSTVRQPPSPPAAHQPATQSQPASSSNKESFVTVAVTGILFAVGSLSPLVILLAFVISSDSFSRDASTAQFVVALAVVASGVTFSFAISVMTMLDHRKDARIRWAKMAGANALLLGGLLMASKVSGQLLDGVMVLSSVRIESANLFLEPEACEMLSAMSTVGDGVGWSPAPNKDSKTCMLYNVTIQSTLEPAMQIACWRHPVRKRASAAAGTADSATSSSSAPAATASTASGPHRPDLLKDSAWRSETLIEKGSFSIPTKHVRNIWKLSARSSEIVSPVCPQDLSVGRIQTMGMPEAK